MTEKINPATGKPHKKILHNNDNMSNLKNLLDKIDRHKSKEQQYTQDETILSATTPFAMLDMKRQLDDMNWRMKNVS